MEKAIEVFMTWQAVMLCLFVYGATYGIRSIVEGFSPSIASNRYWAKLAVPLMPLVMGPLLALIPGFPWPESLGGGMGAHALFGFVCAQFSSQVYARYKDLIKAPETK